MSILLHKKQINRVTKTEVPKYKQILDENITHIDEAETTDEINILNPEEHQTNTDLFYKKYIVDLLPKEYYKKLIDIEEFNFEIFNEVCIKDIISLVLINSSPKNYERREIFREIFHKYDNIKHIFLMGMPDSFGLFRSLQDENWLFGDVLLGNINNTINNFYKHIMGLKYSVYHCPEAPYVISLEENNIINFQAVIKNLSIMKETYGPTDYLQCEKYNHTNATSEIIYNDELEELFHPIYCKQGISIYSWDVAFRIYKEAQETLYNWVDNNSHYIGPIAKKFNVIRKNIYSYSFEDVPKLLNASEILSVYGFQDSDSSQMKRVWSTLLSTVD